MPQDSGAALASIALMDRWVRERRALRVDATDPDSAVGSGRLAPLLEGLGVDALAIHGVKEAFSGSATFFVLGTVARNGEEPVDLDFLELIMPSLHVARQRIYRCERAQGLRQFAVGLTAKEARVLSLIASGMTDEEAARETGRSVHTIKKPGASHRPEIRGAQSGARGPDRVSPRSDRRRDGLCHPERVSHPRRMTLRRHCHALYQRQYFRLGLRINPAS